MGLNKLTVRWDRQKGLNSEIMSFEVSSVFHHYKQNVFEYTLFNIPSSSTHFILSIVNMAFLLQAPILMSPLWTWHFFFQHPLEYLNCEHGITSSSTHFNISIVNKAFLLQAPTLISPLWTWHFLFKHRFHYLYCEHGITSSSTHFHISIVNMAFLLQVPTSISPLWTRHFFFKHPF